MRGVLTEQNKADCRKDIIAHLKASVGHEGSQDRDDARSEVSHREGEGVVKYRMIIEAGSGICSECLDRLNEDKTYQELGDRGKKCMKDKCYAISWACLAWDVQSTRPIPTIATPGCNEVKGIHDR